MRGCQAAAADGDRQPARTTGSTLWCVTRCHTGGPLDSGACCLCRGREVFDSAVHKSGRRASCQSCFLSDSGSCSECVRKRTQRLNATYDIPHDPFLPADRGRVLIVDCDKLQKLRARGIVVGRECVGVRAHSDYRVARVQRIENPALRHPVVRLLPAKAPHLHPSSPGKGGLRRGSGQGGWSPRKQPPRSMIRAFFARATLFVY